jgi:hypothetical protein
MSIARGVASFLGVDAQGGAVGGRVDVRCVSCVCVAVISCWAVMCEVLGCICFLVLCFPALCCALLCYPALSWPVLGTGKWEQRRDWHGVQPDIQQPQYGNIRCEIAGQELGTQLAC